MNEFKTFHPAVNFIYFLSVISFSMIMMHPAALIISLVCGYVYSIISGGSVKQSLVYMIPVFFISAVVNPLFNHEGQTILTYFKNDNPLTLESIVYGIAAAAMLISVICHFSNFNRVMTSDKIMYLFGRIIPSLSLVISMALRFVPRFAEQMRNISQAQSMLGKRADIGRLKRGIKVLSIVITWSLENSVQTADSMRSRGYGERFRTFFSIYRFDKRDGAVLSIIIALSLWLIFANIKKYTYFVYFPTFVYSHNIYTFISFTVYFALCIIPIFIEIREAVKWNVIRQRI